VSPSRRRANVGFSVRLLEGKVHHALQQIPHPQLSIISLEVRQEWRQVLKHNGIGLRFNEQELSPKAVADLWINGYYFFNDDDKAVDKLYIV
jgi:hypothetical protein